MRFGCDVNNARTTEQVQTDKSDKHKSGSSTVRDYSGTEAQYCDMTII